MPDATISIRQEQEKDHEAVFDLISRAFEKEAMSDHKEQFLVQRLRKSPTAFVPELSLVAVTNDHQTVVGHVLLTKIRVVDGEDQEWESLALAPVSVSPDHQKKGIGGKLIRAAHDQARAMGHGSVVLLGHETYYPRFGYKTCDSFGISLPYEGIPKEACMAIELIDGALKEVKGVVRYPKEFDG